MIRGIIIKSHNTAERSADPCDNESNPDWEYMKNCHYVDEHRPDTWKTYPKNVMGANDIIKMEYEELMKCAKMGDMKGWEENIYHLSVALLNAWRLYKHDGK